MSTSPGWKSPTRFLAAVVVLALGPPTQAQGPDAVSDAEIRMLIERIGHDGCTLVRNGRRLTASQARRQLRSKYRRNRHLVDSAETFVHRIASASATTGRPYRVRCRGVADEPAGAWFGRQLALLRSAPATR